MENNQSWRHHYIPKYYLKGFTNSKGQFYIYDKRNDKILGLKSPEQYFFERDRNTFETADGEIDDFVEIKLYSLYDSITAKLFTQVRDPNFHPENTDYKFLHHVIMFINGIFYRIPKYDEYHLNQILMGNERYFITIIDKEGNDHSKEFYEKKKNFPLYTQACRMSMTMKDIVLPDGEGMNWKVHKLPDTFKNKCCLVTSDVPIVIKNPESFATKDEFILAPLSQDVFVFRSTNPIDEERYNLEPIHYMNLMMFLQCERYVCSPYKKVIEFYSQEYKKYTESQVYQQIQGLFNTK